MVLLGTRLQPQPPAHGAGAPVLPLPGNPLPGNAVVRAGGASVASRDERERGDGDERAVAAGGAR
jgi:hypothetical protein